MRTPTNELPIKVDAPGAVARHQPGFGEADVPMAAEHDAMAAGTDLGPLLVGLEHDLCQAQHWGFLISGVVVVTYDDGTTERCTGGDVLHWRGGHTVRVDEDAELILFSPQVEHGAVLDHIASKARSRV